MSPSPDLSPPSPHSRKSRRIICWLLIAITLLTLIAGAWTAGPGYQRRRFQIVQDSPAVRALRNLGATVEFDENQPIWSRIPVVKVDFTRTPATDDDLGWLADFSELAIVELRGTKITDKGLAKLKTLPLESLGLDGTDVSDAGMRDIAEIQSLEYLLIDGTRITDAGLIHLLRLPRLQVLSAERRVTGSFALSFGHDGVHQLPNLPAGQTGETRITNAGLKTLSSIKRLRVLHLGGAEISDEGLSQLASLTNLDSLVLNGTMVSDAGLPQLLRMTKLTLLRLGGTKITDAGLPTLAKLKSLKSLGLDDTQITNSGLRSLSALTSLRFLFLERTQVDQDGVAELKKAIPGLYIEFPRRPVAAISGKSYAGQ